jgi:hypothetical protein
MNLAFQGRSAARVDEELLVPPLPGGLPSPGGRPRLADQLHGWKALEWAVAEASGLLPQGLESITSELGHLVSRTDRALHKVLTSLRNDLTSVLAESGSAGGGVGLEKAIAKLAGYEDRVGLIANAAREEMMGHYELLAGQADGARVSGLLAQLVESEQRLEDADGLEELEQVMLGIDLGKSVVTKGPRSRQV